jgi:uncharacterized SAM-binding protein YcdF (DUF218 family)
MPEYLFLIKKVLGALLMPLPLATAIIIFSVFLYYSRYVKTAKCLLGGLFISGYLFSISPVSQAVVGYLEFQYPKYNKQTVDYVLVLGGYHKSDKRFPTSSLLSQTSLMRLVEGINIHRLNPGSKLLLSGYKGRDIISNAEAMSKVAQEMGVLKSNITLATSPKDTAEEAAYWTKFIRDKSFALVTSATHMPRSVFLFQQALQSQALDADKLIPAPTVFMAKNTNLRHWRSWLPYAGNLNRFGIAWHEYLGLAWAKISK